MPSLNIDLQDGFINDHVIIFVDTVEVFNQGSIKSNKMLGLAGQFHTTCQGRRALVSIKVTNRNIEREVEISLDHITALGISIVDDQLFIRKSNTPFAYA